ncbi:conserved hypothetical protein, partial [Ricinus communis]
MARLDDPTMMMRASYVGLASSALMAPRSKSGRRPARVTSMGLRSRTASLPVCNARSAAAVASSGAGVSKPATPRSSETKVPAPPVEVRIATRLPCSARPVARAAGISSRSEKVRARMTPTCLNSASYILSAPARAPVWETAAFAPASERPILKATTGLPRRAAFRQAARNFSGLRTVSTYNAMTLVAGSSARWSTKSASS